MTVGLESARAPYSKGDHRQLGVATSGSILFRQVGGSIGVAGFGAIFANYLAGDLDQRLPAGMHVPAAANPAALKALTPPLHTAYVTAVTDAPHPVFLAAAGAAALAFVPTWFLRAATGGQASETKRSTEWSVTGLRAR